VRYAESGKFTGGTVTQVDERVWAIDLGFQGWDKVVHAYLLAAPDELALIETGPTATLPALYSGIQAAGFDPAKLRKVFVSHIHLDHSGAAGVIVRNQPEVEVFVHPVGAPHLIDPSRLVSSAARLYTDRMDELWGEVAPVPEERVVPLTDGETLEAAGHVLSVLRAPRRVLGAESGDRFHGGRRRRAYAGLELCPAARAAAGAGARSVGGVGRSVAPNRPAPALPDARRAVRRCC
jgi:hypothetical protein